MAGAWRSTARAPTPSSPASAIPTVGRLLLFCRPHRARRGASAGLAHRRRFHRRPGVELVARMADCRVPLGQQDRRARCALPFLTGNPGVCRRNRRPWENSAWMPARLADDAKRSAWVKAADDWAIDYSALLDAGLNSKLPDDFTIAMPQPVDPAHEAAHRMAMLKALRHARSPRLRTSRPRRCKRQEEPAPEAPQLAPSIAETASVKALSYRTVVTFSHLFVNYGWTGSYIITAELEILQIIINSAKFYAHEMGWETYLQDIPHGDLGRIVDFNYIGVNSG